MKTVLITLSAVALAAPLFAEDIADKYPGYKLEFAEEFNSGSVPDAEKWQFETGMRRNHED